MPHFVSGLVLDPGIGSFQLITLVIYIPHLSDIGDFTPAVIRHMLFFGISESAGEIQVPFIIEGLPGNYQ